ncbi:MAG: hypothetical protein J6T16_03120 [Opitutales bacterium]|nr:hypothetical protein [Opitutales bacterium]
MDVIVLTGKVNSGKTTTLNKLFEKIHKLQNAEILRKNEIEGNRDFSAILKIDSIKIGIISYGDYLVQFKEVFNEFEKEQVDILICAARSKETDNSVFQFVFRNLENKHNIELALTTFPSKDLDRMADKIANAIVLILRNRYLSI